MVHQILAEWIQAKEQLQLGVNYLLWLIYTNFPEKAT